MPTTSSPWASPSSPAGRRLLQAEPATADHIPVLDDALLALGATLVAASSTPPQTPTAVRRPAPRGPVRRLPVARRALVAAALAVGLVAAGAGAGTVLDRPAPAAASGAASATPTSFALARVAGAAMATDIPQPTPTVPDGQVVVALLDPTRAVVAAPLAATPTLAGRLGLLVATASGSSV